MSQPRGLYIAGTGAKVGKTVVARALAAALVNRGVRIAVMKPVETGCPLQAPLPAATDAEEAPVPAGDAAGALDAEEVASLQRLEAAAGPLPANLGARLPRGSLRARDALALVRAARIDAAQLDRVNPYRFAPALEPAVAARASETTIDLDVIVDAHQRLRRGAELSIVEGTSGLLAPLTPTLPMLQLPLALELSVLLVSTSRYGAINDCLLNIELLRTRGLPLAGVVLNRLTPELHPEEAANPYQIERCSDAVVRGVLPRMTPAQLEDLDEQAKRVETHLDLDGILTSLGLTRG